MLPLKQPALFRQQCYINGKWEAAESGKTFPVFNPFDQLQLGTVPDCGANETNRAIVSAHAAWPAWRDVTAQERCHYLLRWADLIRAHKEDLATLITLEQGKPLIEARAEVDYGNAFIEWFAQEARRVYGDIIPANKPNQRILVLKQAIGVVAAIAPWNFPLAMITRKCAPALAAGCPVVIKPAEATPFTALALAYLAEQAQIPAGVINVITGDPKTIGAQLTSHPLVRKVSFTGSTAVGKLLMAQSSQTLKKLSLELGGNAPFIIFDDANLDAAIAGVLASKFRNSGQTCVCANRILVADSIYDIFTEKLVKAVQQLKLGNGLVPDVTQGPLINTAGLEKVKQHVDDALAKGAQIRCGGKISAVGKLFFEPTVLTEVTKHMLIAREETFGPVAALFRFKTEEDAIFMANDTEFGLASYFYTTNHERIWRVAERLEYGMVGINAGIISTEVAPFGGIKESGMGREGSKYGMEDYLEIKYVCLN